MTENTETTTKKMTYNTQAASFFMAIFALIFMAATGQASIPKPDLNFDNKLIGTWKLVSAKYGGQQVKLDQANTSLKHITTAQFMWASYDKAGKLTRAGGGYYSLKGQEYTEKPAYGMGEDFNVVKGKVQKFTAKIEANKWHLSGKLNNGLTIEEVWERVEVE